MYAPSPRFSFQGIIYFFSLFNFSLAIYTFLSVFDNLAEIDTSCLMWRHLNYSHQALREFFRPLTLHINLHKMKVKTDFDL